MLRALFDRLPIWLLAFLLFSVISAATALGWHALDRIQRVEGPAFSIHTGPMESLKAAPE